MVSSYFQLAFIVNGIFLFFVFFVFFEIVFIFTVAMRTQVTVAIRTHHFIVTLACTVAFQTGSVVRLFASAIVFGLIADAANFANSLTNVTFNVHGR
jgi:hypothetical protein